MFSCGISIVMFIDFTSVAVVSVCVMPVFCLFEFPLSFPASSESIFIRFSFLLDVNIMSMFLCRGVDMLSVILHI